MDVLGHLGMFKYVLGHFEMEEMEEFGTFKDVFRHFAMFWCFLGHFCDVLVCFVTFWDVLGYFLHSETLWDV